jgi:hypothetical protein
MGILLGGGGGGREGPLSTLDCNCLTASMATAWTRTGCTGCTVLLGFSRDRVCPSCRVFFMTPIRAV